MRQKLGRVVTWVVTLSLLAYVFWKVPVAQFLVALRGGASWTVPVLALLMLAIYAADCLAMWKTFGWFVAPLGLGEVALIRGATYLLAAVNYALGQGGIVYFVNRKRGVPVIRGAAAVLLIMGINVLVLLLMSTVGLLVGGESIPALKTILAVGYAGLSVYAVAVVAKPRFLTKRPMFDVLLTAGITGYLKALVVRIPHVLTLILFSYTGLRAFGVAVPFSQALLCLPLAYFVAPISIQGLGTTQAVMFYFFARYAPPGDRSSQEAAVLAASLASQAVALGVQLCISLVCLRSQTARDLKQMPAAS